MRAAPSPLCDLSWLCGNKQEQTNRVASILNTNGRWDLNFELQLPSPWMARQMRTALCGEWAGDSNFFTPTRSTVDQLPLKKLKSPAHLPQRAARIWRAIQEPAALLFCRLVVSWPR